jgi:ParB family chromosome partitioning protein
MQQTSPANSSTSSSPVFRKNTTEAAAVRAQTALSHNPQFGFSEDNSAAPARQDGRVPMRNTYRIEIELIEPDPDQPRRYFDQEALKELAASIQARGIRQPLTVRWEPNSRKYRITDGEFRYRAAGILGLKDLPCLLAETDSRDTLIDQIVHNWQRADLRPYEMADALVRLKKDFGMTLTDIARLTGKSIGEVGKLIALVEKVISEVQERVREVGNASLTKRHLYTLSQLAPDEQKRLAGRIEREQLTVLETERLVRAGLEPAKRKETHSPGRPRKHIRIATKYGLVQLTPADPQFTDETLLAMLREARRELSGAEFPEK